MLDSPDALALLQYWINDLLGLVNVEEAQL